MRKTETVTMSKLHYEASVDYNIAKFIFQAKHVA